MYVLERVLAQVSDILLHNLQVAILHTDPAVERTWSHHKSESQ